MSLAPGSGHGTLAIQSVAFSCQAVGMQKAGFEKDDCNLNGSSGLFISNSKFSNENQSVTGSQSAANLKVAQHGTGMSQDLIGTNQTPATANGQQVNEPVVLGTAKRKRRRIGTPKLNGLTEEQVLQKVLPDHLAPNLDIVVVGINPGLASAAVGHHYAGPANHFWKCMFMSGLISEPLTAEDDARMLDCGIGFTNIVARTTRNSSELSRKEIKAGSLLLKEKIQQFRPKVVVFNGIGIYELFLGRKDFHVGKQPLSFPGVEETAVFVMPSSSARFTQLPRAVDKLPFYEALKKLRDFLCGRRPAPLPAEVSFPDANFRIIPKHQRPGYEGSQDGAETSGKKQQAAKSKAAAASSQSTSSSRTPQRKTGSKRTLATSVDTTVANDDSGIDLGLSLTPSRNGHDVSTAAVKTAETTVENLMITSGDMAQQQQCERGSDVAMKHGIPSFSDSFMSTLSTDHLPSPNHRSTTNESATCFSSPPLKFEPDVHSTPMQRQSTSSGLMPGYAGSNMSLNDATDPHLDPSSQHSDNRNFLSEFSSNFSASHVLPPQGNHDSNATTALPSIMAAFSPSACRNASPARPGSNHSAFDRGMTSQNASVHSSGYGSLPTSPADHLSTAVKSEPPEHTAVMAAAVELQSDCSQRQRETGDNLGDVLDELYSLVQSVDTNNLMFPQQPPDTDRAPCSNEFDALLNPMPNSSKQASMAGFTADFPIVPPVYSRGNAEGNCQPSGGFSHVSSQQQHQHHQQQQQHQQQQHQYQQQQQQQYPVNPSFMRTPNIRMYNNYATVPMQYPPTAMHHANDSSGGHIMRPSMTPEHVASPYFANTSSYRPTAVSPMHERIPPFVRGGGHVPPPLNRQRSAPVIGSSHMFAPNSVNNNWRPRLPHAGVGRLPANSMQQQDSVQQPVVRHPFWNPF